MAGVVRVARAAGAPPSPEAAGDDRINRHEAAALLGTTEPIVAGLVREGLLPRSGHAYWTLRRSDVVAFRQTYVLTAEIARRLGIRNWDVRAWLAERGVEPVASVMRRGGFAWLRSDVTTFGVQLPD